MDSREGVAPHRRPGCNALLVTAFDPMGSEIRPHEDDWSICDQCLVLLRFYGPSGHLGVRKATPAEIKTLTPDLRQQLVKAKFAIQTVAQRRGES